MMRTGIQRGALVCMVVLSALSGSLGCQNVCQRFDRQLALCTEEVCGEHEESTLCAAVALDLERLQVCSDEASELARTQLGQSCETILAQFEAADEDPNLPEDTDVEAPEGEGAD